MQKKASGHNSAALASISDIQYIYKDMYCINAQIAFVLQNVRAGLFCFQQYKLDCRLPSKERLSCLDSTESVIDGSHICPDKRKLKATHSCSMVEKKKD